ncbi:MAG: hypothetical protein ABJA78_06070 [Ferruginibacter sp.]
MTKKLLFVFSAAMLLSLTSMAQAPKGDPWIFQVYKELYNRQPTAWELNIHNYNDGSWSNYNDLKTYIQNYQSALSTNGLTVSLQPMSNNRSAALFNQAGKTIAADLITNDGGSIVAQGGGNIVAQGGGNIVAQGGLNMKEVAGLGFGPKYTLQAVGTKVIPVSGKVAFIIKK